jgi:hypothetical protein
LLATPADSASATDAASQVGLSQADTATAIDAATYAATLSDADAATLSDALSQIAVSGFGDTMTMSEAASFTATVADTDQATGSDLATLITLMGLSESALISEFASVIETNMINVMDADAATITEAAYLTILAADVRGGFTPSGSYGRHKPIITRFPATPSIFDVASRLEVEHMEFDRAVYMRKLDEDEALMMVLGLAA